MTFIDQLNRFAKTLNNCDVALFCSVLEEITLYVIVCTRLCQHVPSLHKGNFWQLRELRG